MKIRNLLLALFLVIGFTANSQTNGSFKSVRFYNVPDSTEFLSTTWANFIARYPNSGGLYYNEQSTKFRVYQDSTWQDLTGTGGGGGGDMFLGLVQTSTAKKTFTGGANAGLNIGSFAGTPAGLVNGDMWVDTGTNVWKARNNGITTWPMTINVAPANTAIPFGTNTFTYNSNVSAFNFLTGSNILTVGDPAGSGAIVVQDASNDATFQGAGITATNQFTISATGAIGINPTTNVTINSDPLEGSFYTPTLTNTTNITSSTAHEIRYQRINDVVSFSGQVDFDATAAGAFLLRISLPYASNFTTVYDASGTATNTNVGGAGMGGMTANVASDVLELFGTAGGTATHIYYFSGSYRVK